MNPTKLRNAEAALVARADELIDVELVHMKTLGDAVYTRPEDEGHTSSGSLKVSLCVHIIWNER